MTEESKADDREDQLEKVTEEFLQRLRLNEKPSTTDFAKDYPDLAPDLERRLKLVESIYKAADSDASKKTMVGNVERTSNEIRAEGTIVADVNDAAARFNCPHCGNKVQLVGLAAHAVTCLSCGSSLRIARPPTSGSDKNSVPKQVGRFIVKRVLGEGAFGIVYLATDPQLGREVAVKAPRNGFFPTHDEERRFFREAKHAASLQHPNIVQVFEISEGDGTPLIVSEYIDGLTLNDVANGNLMSFKETTGLMIQIANAVEFAHQKGVIHRDLKPGNILIDADRNAYITDFGLAYRDDAEITMTLDGAILGTPAYMSPEQAEGNQKLVGRRSDVYSLGVILYRLTTKDLPFHGTKRMLVRQVIHDDPKSPRVLNDRIPRDLETITLKAMAKSPEARYQSAAEFAEELQRFLMGEPIQARPISNLARFARWCVKRPVVATLGSSVAALMIACVLISALWALHAENLKQAAIKQETIATKNGLESSRRLHDLLMSNGEMEMKQNSLSYASLWYSEALAIEDTPNDRIRLSMIQDRLPTLTHLIAGTGQCKTAVSSDGTRFIVASSSNLQVFETRSKQKLFDERVNGPVLIRFALDGTKVLSAPIAARSIDLWDVDKRRRASTIKHGDVINTFEFDSTSTKFVTGGDDSTVKVWNADDGSQLGQHSFEGLRVVRAVFINQSTLVAVVLARDQELSCKTVIWDFVQDTFVGNEMLQETFVESITLSQDGKRLCIGEDAGIIRVWEISNTTPVGTTIVTNKKLLDAQFTADDSAVIGVFASGEVSTFDYQSGSLLGQFVRQTKLNLLTQSPDSSILALASTDGKVGFVWRESGADVCAPIINGPHVTSIAFLPDGHRVAIAGSSGALQLWDLAGSCPDSVIFQHDRSILNAFFVPNINRCITVSTDGKAYTWDSTTGQRLGEAIEHEGKVYCASLNSKGTLLVTGGIDRSVKVWDCTSGKQVGNSFTHDAKVTGVRISDDDSHVYVGDESGAIRCWKLDADANEEAKPVFEVQQNSEITSLLQSLNGLLLATASVDGLIRLWDAKTGQPHPIQMKHDSKHVLFRFMPDGKRIISTAREDSTTVIWDVSDGSPLARLPSDRLIRDIQVSDGCKRVVTIDLLGRAKVWTSDEQGSYSIEKEFKFASNVAALGVGFKKENSFLVMGGGILALQQGEPQRGAIDFWNYSDGRPLAPTYRQRPTVQQLMLSDDAKSMLIVSDDKTAQFWKIASTTIPSNELQRLSQLYAQSMPDSKGGLKMMDIAMQEREFKLLSAQHPSYFTTSDADLKIWQHEVKRNSNSADSVSR